MQAQLNEQHTLEFENALKDLNEALPDAHPRHTPEILDLNKRLESLVKKKE
jgi:hypothetical protein